jgi:hypothetical protein
MPRLTIKIDGIEETNRKLVKIQGALGTKAVQDVVLTAARAITRAAYQRAPYDPERRVGRHLRSLLFTTVGQRPPAPNNPWAFAGVTLRRAPHAGLVEFGTAERRVKKARTMFGSKYSGVPRAWGQQVKSAPAQPFFIPAVRTATPAVKRDIESGLTNLLQQAAA